MRFLWIGILLLTSGCASIGFQNQTNCIQGLICPEGPKIVPSATRKTYNGEEGNTLKPLLYAGMILEGGIVGMDSNIRTGGSGIRYLGVGAKNQYREDVVTVNLRAVLVQTGEVLLNVTTTKTILSTGAGTDLFRFYELGTELVEMESGSTGNEPVTQAVRTAIEAAVYGLIMEGMEKRLWDFNYGTLDLEDDNEVDKGTQ